jgi:hypothetical protein
MRYLETTAKHCRRQTTHNTVSSLQYTENRQSVKDRLFHDSHKNSFGNEIPKCYEIKVPVNESWGFQGGGYE